MPSWGGAQTARPPGAAASGTVRSPAPASSAAVSPAGARGAASSAAMQRAQRAAESPLRAILEAGKVRRRVEPDPGRPSPAASAAVPAVPAEPPPAAPDGSTAPNAPAADGHGRNGGNGGPVGAPAEEDSPILVIRTLPLDAVSPAAARVVPEPAPAAPPRAAISPPLELPALQPLGVPAVLVPVRLVHMVEPELPARLLDQMVRPEVVVEMTIGSDGRVGDVEVMQPVPRQVAPIVREAVQQWRYAPLPAPRRHRVQIVFRGG